MSLYLAQPAGQTVKNATNSGYYGNYPVVAETPSKGFVYAWIRGRCVDASCNIYIYEIEYAILDRIGNILRAATKLTDHGAATVRTYDTELAVAVTPDGRIELLWQRYLYNQNDSTYNYNLFFAVLDAEGNVLVPATSMTNNNAWGVWDALNIPRFYSPRIAATSNNRLVLAWTQHHLESTGDVQNIFYAVMNSGGGQIKSPTQLTDGVPTASMLPETRSPLAPRTFDSPLPPPRVLYSQPVLSTLSNNRAFLSWERREDGNDDILFAILGSDGNILKGITDLSQDENVIDWNNWDAVQLADGKILAAWEAWGCFPGEWVPRIRYVVLDTSFNRIIAPRCLDRAAAATNGETGVSVTADAAGRGILTWEDAANTNKRHLYYALVDGSGSTVTPAMIFRTNQAIPPSIFSSYQGYGNTTYSWTPPAGVDGYVTVAASPSGSIGGYGKITVSYGNNGAQAASSALLEATLANGLTYDSDTSGLTPTISGQRVRWSLPSLSLLSQSQFTLYVRVGANVAAGTNLPVTFSFSSVGPEANPADNSASTTLGAAPPPGGPDTYGYIWDDGGPLNWVDATGGTDTGMSGSSSGARVGPFRCRSRSSTMRTPIPRSISLAQATLASQMQVTGHRRAASLCRVRPTT